MFYAAGEPRTEVSSPGGAVELRPLADFVAVVNSFLNSLDAVIEFGKRSRLAIGRLN